MTSPYSAFSITTRRRATRASTGSFAAAPTASGLPACAPPHPSVPIGARSSAASSDGRTCGRRGGRGGFRGLGRFSIRSRAEASLKVDVTRTAARYPRRSAPRAHSSSRGRLVDSRVRGCRRHGLTTAWRGGPARRRAVVHPRVDASPRRAAGDGPRGCRRRGVCRIACARPGARRMALGAAGRERDGRPRLDLG